MLHSVFLKQHIVYCNPTTERNWSGMKTRGKKTEDSQGKWNKKKQVNSRSRKKQLLYKRAPPCKHVPTSGFSWPVHPDSYHVAPWLFLQTCLPLNVQKRGKSLPTQQTNTKRTETRDSFILRVSSFLILDKVSPTLGGILFFIWCWTSVAFSALFSTRKQRDNTRKR